MNRTLLAVAAVAALTAGCAAGSSVPDGWRIADAGVNAADQAGVADLLEQVEAQLSRDAAQHGWRVADDARCWASSRPGPEGQRPWLERAVLCGPATSVDSDPDSPWIAYGWADQPLEGATGVELERPLMIARPNPSLTFFRPGGEILEHTEVAAAHLALPDAAPVDRGYYLADARPPDGVAATAPDIEVPLPGETVKLGLLDRTGQHGAGPDAIIAPAGHQLITLAVDVDRHGEITKDDIDADPDPAIVGRIAAGDGHSSDLTDDLLRLRRHQHGPFYITVALPDGDPTVQLDVYGRTIEVDLQAGTVDPTLTPTTVVDRPGRVPNTTVELADGTDLTVGWTVEQAVVGPWLDPHGWADDGHQWLALTVTDPRWDLTRFDRLCPLEHRSAADETIEVVDQDGTVTRGADIDDDNYLAVQLPTSSRQLTVTVAEVRDIALECMPEAGTERHRFGAFTFDLNADR